MASFYRGLFLKGKPWSCCQSLRGVTCTSHWTNKNKHVCNGRQNSLDFLTVCNCLKQLCAVSAFVYFLKRDYIKYLNSQSGNKYPVNLVILCNTKGTRWMKECALSRFHSSLHLKLYFSTTVETIIMLLCLVVVNKRCIEAISMPDTTQFLVPPLDHRRNSSAS